MSTEQLAKWLRFAIRQNEHDMMMTGEELREAAAALAAHEAEKAQAAHVAEHALPAAHGDDLVLVRRGLLGSACYALRTRRPAPKTLEALRAAAMQAVPAAVASPVLVRDVADMLGTTVAAVSAAFVALGHAPRSTNMAVTGEEAVQVAAHLRAAPAAPVAVPMALVPLPDPAEEWQAHNGPDEDGTVSLYTAEQMRQYALDFAAAHGIKLEGGQG